MQRTRALIGDEGTSFRESVVSLSQCCPSRATLLTGRYAHNHGVLSSVPRLGGVRYFDAAETLAVWLQRAGYATGAGRQVHERLRARDRRRPAGLDRVARPARLSALPVLRLHVQRQRRPADATASRPATTRPTSSPAWPRTSSAAAPGVAAVLPVDDVRRPARRGHATTSTAAALGARPSPAPRHAGERSSASALPRTAAFDEAGRRPTSRARSAAAAAAAPALARRIRATLAQRRPSRCSPSTRASSGSSRRCARRASSTTRWSCSPPTTGS